MILSYRFFVIVFFSVIIYWFLPKQWLRNIILISASYVFIFLTDFKTGCFVLLISLFTFAWSFLLAKEKNKILFLRIGMIILILTLFIFKYLLFAGNVFNSSAGFLGIKAVISLDNFFIPLGISYIIFKYVSYLTDIYWGICPRGKLFEFLAYGSFFTIFVAGPIERFRTFQPQINEKKNFLFENISSGIKRIIIGLFKKTVIANWVGFFIAPYILNIKSYDILFIFLILIGFSIQIYADFSGYSDMAIGSSLLFGFKISENFNYPYLQSNISMFWQNWHMTLSSWIRDYIFFPLNIFFKNNLLRIIFVPVIAMGICGFWHGAEWKFIMWGVMHGVGISIYQFWKIYIKKKFKFHLKGYTEKIVGIIITYIFVTLAWFWFI
jgi:alginate O-acetyltransferase complex protein AlgI